MVNSIILVGLGGALGSILRFLCQRALNMHYPYGTLLVNIVGCLLIGILWGMFTRNVNEFKQMLLVTGFCGGFTTFSSFSYEGIEMLMEHRWFTFAWYTGISVTGGLLATYFGFKLSR